MKAINKYLFKLLLFCSIFLLITLIFRAFTLSFTRWRKAASYAIADAKRRQVRANFYIFPDDREKVVFFGASTILSGIIPSLFDELNKQKTYSLNLGMPALPTSSSYYILKDLLSNGQKPDYILLNPTTTISSIVGYGNFFSMYAVEGVTFFEIIDICFNIKNFRVLLNYFYPFINYKDVLKYSVLKFYFDYNLPFSQETKERLKVQYDNDFLFNYHYGDTQAINKELIDCMSENRGYYFIREQVRRSFNIKNPIKNETQLPEAKNSIVVSYYNILKYYQPKPEKESIFNHDVYRKKFFDLAKADNITVFLIGSPAWSENINKKTITSETIPELWGEIICRYPNVFMSNEISEYVYYDRSYFADSLHMNPDGASEFTKLITKQFQIFRDYYLNNIN